MDIEKIRHRRLIQISLSVILCLITIAILQVFTGYILEAAILAIGSLVMMRVYRLAKKGQTDYAATALIAVISIMLVILVSYGSGLRDTALFGFPGIIIFSTMLGKPKLTISILFCMISFCLLLGYLYSANILAEPPLTTNFETGLTISIILAVIGYAIISLHKDLARSVTALKKENRRVVESKKQISHLAHHDALTDLPNRLLAKTNFERAVLKSKRSNNLVAMLYIDIDHFKEINDSLGHQAGDEFLIEIAERLKSCCRQTDTVCRLSGDEFLVIAEDIEHTWQITTLAEKIQFAIAGEIKHADSSLSHTASIGIAVAPTDGETFDDINKKADVALYHSKKNGRNKSHYFDQEQQVKLQRQILLSGALKQAIKHNELFLTYQPKVRIGDERIIGAEALLRWKHPTLGLISPTEFIPIAEQTGLITAIGQWVIEQAIADAPNFINLYAHFQLSLNISVAQVKHGNLVNCICQTLEQHQVTPQTLDIEITESLMADHEGQTQETLQTLQAIGVTVSIDDFGTGYSNLGYLKQFNVETLKIDRSFIFDLANNENNQTIVKAILEICKGLSMTPVAEGVEDTATYELLKQWQCATGQGFLWSKPIVLDEFLTLMNSQQN